VAEAALLAELAGLVPAFWGSLEAAGLRYLRLQDLTAELVRPCVADVKLGRRTADERLGDAARAAKCASKDAATTSAALGIRLAGMQHWAPSGEAWAVVRAERRWCAELTPASLRAALRVFSTCGGALDTDTHVLRGADGLLAQLRALGDWFSRQTLLHFFGASALLLFDAAPVMQEGGCGLRPCVKVRRG